MVLCTVVASVVAWPDVQFRIQAGRTAVALVRFNDPANGDIYFIVGDHAVGPFLQTIRRSSSPLFPTRSSAVACTIFFCDANRRVIFCCRVAVPLTSKTMLMREIGGVGTKAPTDSIHDQYFFGGDYPVVMRQLSCAGRARFRCRIVGHLRRGCPGYAWKFHDARGNKQERCAAEDGHK